MSLTESRYKISNNTGGYVSHSFNQFIAASGNNIMTLEQQESPFDGRNALMLVQADSGSFPNFTKDTKTISAFDFAPGTENQTGASLGAFCALPGGNLLTAGNSVRPDSEDLGGQRNIFISCIPGVDASQEDTEIHWLTDYGDDAEVRVSTPQAMVLPDGSGLAVLWTENGVLRHAFTDTEGNLRDGKIYTSEGAISDCVPVLSGDRFFWYVTDNSTPVFYSLEAKTGGKITAINTAEKPEKPEEPEEPEKPAVPDEPVKPVVPDEPAEPEEPEKKQVFRDVPEDAYFAEAVRWAAENGIACGTDIGLFSPEDSCTRAQALTFLWRSAGSPEPRSAGTSFRDVEPGSYYEKAAAWAEEKDIANGMGGHCFCPELKVTRAQFVTFLWRHAGRPEPASASSRLQDIEAGSYYEKAALWAVENGILQGMTPTAFKPETCCTRAQAVTFLQRYIN